MICLERQLPLEVTKFFFAILVIKQLTDDLLSISVAFTRFYKIENIVMYQIEIDCVPHSFWNISSAILKILLFFKTWHS